MTDRTMASLIEPCFLNTGLREKLTDRKSEETWSTGGRRHLNLTLKLSEGCTTAKKIAELVSTEALLKLMPRQMATYGRDRKPKT